MSNVDYKDENGICAIYSGDSHDKCSFYRPDKSSFITNACDHWYGQRCTRSNDNRPPDNIISEITDEILNELDIPALTANFSHKVIDLADKIYHGKLETIKRKDEDSNRAIENIREWHCDWVDCDHCQVQRGAYCTDELFKVLQKEAQK